MQKNLDYYLEKAKVLHGDICAGIVLGARITLTGMRELGMDPDEHNRDLIVFVEIDRCMTDAAQAITGTTLGHRTLKYVNYGKFAATFYDLASGKAVRVSRRDKVKYSGQDMKEYFKTAPEDEIIEIEKVEIEMSDFDLPGYPRRTEECCHCGELTFDGRGVGRKGSLLCRACADGSYYKKEKVNNETD
ncbi:MAG: FmdE family protein [Dehalococcoidales bacterium]|nr:FmdE family protein [Dehalococcoidales bacterium]